MRVKITDRAEVSGRVLLPGYEVDSDTMPVFAENALQALVDEGKAEKMRTSAPRQAKPRDVEKPDASV